MTSLCDRLVLALFDVFVFGGKTLIIVLCIAAILLLIGLLVAKSQIKSELEVEAIDKKWKHFSQTLKHFALSKNDLKKEAKKISKWEKEKAKAKTKKEDQAYIKKVYLIDFVGDIKASEAENLAIEVNAILNVANPKDEVVVRIESPGGVVHGYGLAASQLMRIREKNIPLTVCVDKVAASGGYLMSVPANKILAAPFAIIGSIGVVAQVPNIYRLLKKHDVDFKEYTAGEYKRTVSLMGEITEKGETKFKEQLESTHVLFKDFVGKFRPQLKLSEVATGEYWYGEEAKSKGLIDEIKTSDAYLMELASGPNGDYLGDEALQILKVKFEKKASLTEKLGGFFGKALTQSLEKAASKFFSDGQQPLL